MTVRLTMYKRLQALLLILLAIFFAQKFWSGQLYYYIGPRFGWLSLVAIVLLIVIAGAHDLTQGRGEPDAAEEHNHADGDHNHRHEVGDSKSVWPLLLVALPLILGVAIPPTPLGASAIPSRGMTTEVAVSADEAATTLTIIPGERNVLDWVRAINADPNPAALTGEEADVVGFVYRDPRFSDDQFMVGRFTITCCVADALAVGLVVEADSASEFPSDSWVRITGTFDQGTLDGEALPVLFAETITPVQQPEQPYLYP